jgi:uncharacterized membrane protein
MSLLPDWAPNLHPLVIHFPIVLLISAVVVDAGDAIWGRPPWLGIVGTSLYAAGAATALLAFATGLQAASTVLIPGMAYPIISDHRAWALATTAYFGVLAAVRVTARFAGVPRARGRVLWLAVGLLGMVLLQQTAERGARLVYEFGTGVIGAPR